MGKSSKQTVGYRYKLAYHAGLGVGPIDAFLEFRGGTKTAWSGRLTASGTITINQPKLWGGDKDQGGIKGDVHLMFGEATQQPSAYLTSVFGPQQSAWRGLSTLVFAGGLYGSMNPYPQPASYKIERITRGWFDGLSECWYAGKSVVTLASDYANTDTGWRYLVTSPAQQNWDAPAAADFDDGTWAVGAGGFGSSDPSGSLGIGTYVPTGVSGRGIWIRRKITAVAGQPLAIDVWHDDGAWLWVNGQPIELTLTVNYYHSTAVVPGSQVASSNVVALKVLDAVPAGSPTNIYAGLDISQPSVTPLRGINLAHALYYARTHSLIGREPVESMNDASWRAAADWYYAQGFGVCVEYDPSAESLADYESRLCKLGGCSITRSLTDGQLYIDIANGEYDLAALPILTDDDILDFSEQPTVLDSAVNSLQVKYFDPQKKEDVITPPVQILGLIDAFGTISQTNEYPEIPTGDLGLRVAERDVRAAGTPTRAFDLVCTRKPRDWRPNTYFRLQAPKRGIADMVCIVGTHESGTLKSGAIKMTATQDIYSLSSSTFVEQEPGVDTRPDETAAAITLQKTFEAPYIVVCTALDRANLDLLPTDVGYLQAVAADPASSRDYTMTVADAGGDYVETVHGDWCPTATVNEAASSNPAETAFTLSAGTGLADVMVGTAALWGDEIVRIDAIDANAGTLTVGRGCADTPSTPHAAGERIWFVGADDVASDSTEYTDGESLSIKLLTNTASQQLDPALATAMPVEMMGRQARPYPPAAPTLNGEAMPTLIFSTADVAWLHRDRKAQADQLIDQTAASIGPEAGTTYTVRWYLGGALVNAASGITGASASYAPTADGALRVEIESVRDGLTSLHMQVIECSYRVSPYSDYVDHAGNAYADQDGTTYQG